ncbi:WhiB family transcriptional regulator [Gephyromycinifex aptenodytis]|uniref:WhiB family transcriptional regulator n=1 Tax=Gephyromycinifex aptenodytis TaxID=2716227 RepID=UPI001447CC15|nr:WhiB family transcriptional regulator [Gephyromycinifex aptenodytis]
MESQLAGSSPPDVGVLEATRVASVRNLDKAPACSSPLLGLAPADWTPEQEADRVPPALAAICASCPVAAACLLDAVRMNDVGYRGGTTTRERRRMFPGLRLARREELDQDGRSPRHARGEGSLACYRRGCRCDECRSHNAAARRRERARAS